MQSPKFIGEKKIDVSLFLFKDFKLQLLVIFHSVFSVETFVKCDLLGQLCHILQCYRFSCLEC